MRLYLIILISGILCVSVPASEIVSLRVKDEATTFPVVETLITESGSAYWGNKALGSVFGAEAKPEGENLIILCRDEICVPFYMDDPQNPVVERKGKPYLLAVKVAESLGYKRIELDLEAGEIRMYHTEKPTPGKPETITFPQVILSDLSGNMVSLSEITNQKKVIIAWSPWDGGSTILSQWNRMVNDSDNGVKLILVAETMESRERLEPFLSMLKPRPLCLMDSGMRLTLQFKLKKLPAIFLINKEGTLIYGPESLDPGNENFNSKLNSWIAENEIDFMDETPVELRAFSEIEEAEKRIQLAHTLWISGKNDEAISEFKTVQKTFPENPVLKKQLEVLENEDKFYPLPTPTQAPSLDKPSPVEE